MSYVVITAIHSRNILFVSFMLVMASSVTFGQPVQAPSKARQLMDEGHALLLSRKVKDAYAKFEEAWLAANDELRDSPEDKINLAIVQNVLGNTALELGLFKKAVAHQQTSLKLKRDAFPRDNFANGHEQLVIGHRNLANALMLANRSTDAVSHHRIAADMAITLAKDGDCAADLPPQCLLALADSLILIGANEEAHAKSESALRMVEQLFPRSLFPNGHDALAGTMNRIGTTRQAMGDYEGALEVYLKAKSMIDVLHPLDDETLTAHSLLGHRNINNYLGNTCQLIGDYAQARVYFEKGVQVARRLHAEPEGHPSLAGALLNLALVQRFLGEYDTALETLSEAEKILLHFFPESEYPMGHPKIAQLLTNTAHIYQQIGRLDEAISLRKQVVETYRGFAQDDGGKAALADALADLGLTYAEANDHARAEPVFQESLVLFRALFPVERHPAGHPTLVTAIANVGGCLLWLNQLDEAKVLLEEADAMNSRLYPPDAYPNGHPTSHAIFNLLASEAGRRSDRKDALRWLLKEHRMINDLARVNLAGLSTAESLNFAEAANLRVPGLLISTLSGTSDQKDLAEVYEVVSDRRFLVYRFARRRNQLASIAFDARDTLFSEYERTNRMLSRRSRQSVDSEQREQFFGELKLLQDNKEELEREIARRIPGFLEQFEAAHASPEELRGQLPTDGVLIDFVRYVRFPIGDPDEQSVLSYGAFVITNAGMKFVRVGQADQIEPAIERALSALANIQPVSDALKELRTLLWDKLSSALPPGTNHLIICPDEAIAKVAWCALPDGTGQPLVNRYTITTIPHCESIAQATYDDFSKGGAVDGKLLFVGDLDYGEPYKPYQLLPGTEYNPALFGAKVDSDVTKLVGRKTDVECGQILSSLAKVDVAHLATHGYVHDVAPPWPSRFDARARSPAGVLGTINAEVLIRNPFVGVGIACSQANRPEVNDRFLTGEDVAGSSFPSLRLAFLAVCNSNRGRTKGGEGTFGLQRAFHAAGTDTVVASLWRADDLATQFITERFYSLLREGHGPTEALRQAQRAIAAGELSDDARHPYFWAGWSVSGDPGPLPTQFTPTQDVLSQVAPRSEVRTSTTWLYYGVVPLVAALLCLFAW